VQPKEIKELLKHLEAQGAQIKNIHNGWMIYPPDPNAQLVAIHKTPSDWRAEKKLRSQLRKSGFDV